MHFLTAHYIFTISGLPAGIGRATLNRLRSAPQPARLLALLQVGFTEPSRSPGTLVVSYTTVSPLPAPRGPEGPRGRWRSVLCGTVPQVALGGCCPPPRPVESGPSSTGT